MGNEVLELARVLAEIEQKYAGESLGRMIAAAYVLWLGRKYAMVDIDNLQDFIDKAEIDKSTRLFIIAALNEHWAEYRRYITAFSEEGLREFILTAKPDSGRSSFAMNTPESVIKLALAALKLSPEDSIADFGAGIGDFLCKAYGISPQSQYFGNEIAADARAIASIRAALLGQNILVEQEDMFDSKRRPQRFNKIFCHPPYGLRLGSSPNMKRFLETLPPSVPLLKGTGSCEWIFALRMLAELEPGGKAVLLMSNAGTWNSQDMPIRKYFIERGLIQTVIALPERLLEYTGLACTLVVFSDKNNAVEMVDATGAGIKGRRNTELSDQDIAQIVHEGKDEGNILRKLVPCSEILDNDCMLNPTRYLQETIQLEHQVAFGDIIDSITRGASLAAHDLDQLISTEPTAYQYLMLSNIQNGIIDKNLPYLSNIEPHLKKYLLQPNHLVLSKNGYPFKVAVAQPEEGREILGNGNLFIITLKEDVADPYYVKAFLESEKGVSLLKRIAVGAAIPNISLEALRNLPISLPPLEIQRKISERYQNKLNELAQLTRKLERVHEELAHILD